MTEIEEEFEDFKAQRILEHPDKEEQIKACKTVRELYEICHEDEGETGGESGAEAPKDLGIVRHVHEIAKRREEEGSGDSGMEGGEDLSKTGGKIPLQNLGDKPKSWETQEQMLDELFQLETLGKIEATRKKPKREVIEQGEKAGRMIEKLYSSGMKSGRLSRAGKQLDAGRYVFEEAEWVRQARNPQGRKKPKEKPYLVESL